jgi:hypothetical protein
VRLAAVANLFHELVMIILLRVQIASSHLPMTLPAEQSFSFRD